MALAMCQRFVMGLNHGPVWFRQEDAEGKNDLQLAMSKVGKTW